MLPSPSKKPAQPERGEEQRERSQERQSRGVPFFKEQIGPVYGTLLGACHTTTKSNRHDADDIPVDARLRYILAWEDSVRTDHTRSYIMMMERLPMALIIMSRSVQKYFSVPGICHVHYG